MAGYILGRKVGMTRVFDEEGRSVPVTVVEAGLCTVSQVKTVEKDGYAAIQLAFGQRKTRNTPMPMIGHDAKAGVAPAQWHREFRVDEGELEGVELGQSVTVDSLEGAMFIDVTGTSKGKGTQGVMKRWGFKGQLASHGVERKHRSPGSLSGRSSNTGTGKPKKGQKMGGRMGNASITVRSLPIVSIDKENNVLLVKGPVPGANGSLLKIRGASRLYKRKAQKLAEAG